MKIRIIFLSIVILLIITFIYFVFKNQCKKENVSENELVGTYVMKYNSVVDTLIINKNYTFYHSSDNGNGKYTRNGTWHSTVDGYFELLNYSSAAISNSWDMKPYKCRDMIYIEDSYDGSEMYVRIFF